AAYRHEPGLAQEIVTGACGSLRRGRAFAGRSLRGFFGAKVRSSLGPALPGLWPGARRYQAGSGRRLTEVFTGKIEHRLRSFGGQLSDVGPDPAGVWKAEAGRPSSARRRFAGFRRTQVDLFGLLRDQRRNGRKG